MEAVGGGRVPPFSSRGSECFDPGIVASGVRRTWRKKGGVAVNDCPVRNDNPGVLL